eukprot:jgi/Undpi1/11710/HiC_scaffold_37.g14005.m1
MTVDLERPVRVELWERFQEVRGVTEVLAAPLEPEDMVVQTMPDVSPTKWHLAHVTWFFETFVLRRHDPDYRVFAPEFEVLFNSYYQQIGKPYPRPRRGLLSRPTAAEVLGYRAYVDNAMRVFLDTASEATLAEVAPTITVGLQHEQQHQELLLMDIKHVLGSNPMRPKYCETAPHRPGDEQSAGWVGFEGGVVEVGHRGGAFAFDNELPRHDVLLRPFELGSRLVVAREYLAFMADGGYERTELWLADGWDLVQKEGWRAPLYWQQHGDDWHIYTLGGARLVTPNEPVCHVSHYEADAFAAWAGARLPTEHEWEWAAQQSPQSNATVLEDGVLHPQGLPRGDAGRPVTDGACGQMFGELWEWTASPYVAYPGYQPFTGKLGEYNGKFMSNQMVLRGGCVATPADHVRASYRNFYYPHQRWMFSGIRLAR